MINKYGNYYVRRAIVRVQTFIKWVCSNCRTIAITIIALLLIMTEWKRTLILTQSTVLSVGSLIELCNGSVHSARLSCIHCIPLHSTPPNSIYGEIPRMRLHPLITIVMAFVRIMEMTIIDAAHVSVTIFIPSTEYMHRHSHRHTSIREINQFFQHLGSANRNHRPHYSIRHRNDHEKYLFRF